MLYNSIYKLLNNNENGELSKCWLAATNKKSFESLEPENIENIAVPNLCNEILNNVPSVDKMHSSCLSFSSAAKLMFGVVLIFKTQVDNLFEKTRRLNDQKHLLFFGALGRSNLNTNKISPTEPSVNRSRKKKSKFGTNYFSWTSDDILTELEVIEKLGENQISMFDENVQCKRNEDISLKEVFNDELWKKNVEENEEDFLGQITDLEVQFFSEIVAKKQISLECNNLNQSIELVRSAENNYNANTEVDMLNMSLNDLNDTEVLDSIQMDNAPIVEETITSQIVRCDSIDAGLPTLMDSEIIHIAKQGTKRRKLVIDSKIEFSGNYLKNRAITCDTLRCTIPREDIVPSHQIKFIPAEKLLLSFGSRISNLYFNFHKKLKRKKELNNMKGILNDILGKPTLESNEELLHCSTSSKRRKTDYANEKNTLSENRIFNLNDSRKSQIVKKNLSITHFSDYQEQNITEQIIQEFPVVMLNGEYVNEILTNEALYVKRRTIEQFNVLSIIRKLLKLWHQNVYPINLSVLFDPYLACKLGAAKGFASILELNGKRFIKIIKDDTNNNIIHIEPGEKIPRTFA